MTGPYVLTQSDLERQIDLNRGWLIVHTGDPRDRSQRRGAHVFEETRRVLEARRPLTFLRYESRPARDFPLPWDLPEGGTVQIYYDSVRLESLASPATEDDLTQWIDFVVSFHTAGAAE